jgi:hypothetical protein
MVTEAKIIKYDVWSLDILGNAKDGWDMNDRSCHARAVEFPTTHEVYNRGTEAEFSTDHPTDQQILDTLIEIGYFNNSATLDTITIDGECEFSLWLEQSADGFPVCQLDRVE